MIRNKLLGIILEKYVCGEPTDIVNNFAGTTIYHKLKVACQ
jgi:hypothetical protein